MLKQVKLQGDRLSGKLTSRQKRIGNLLIMITIISKFIQDHEKNSKQS